MHNTVLCLKSNNMITWLVTVAVQKCDRRIEYGQPSQWKQDCDGNTTSTTKQAQILLFWTSTLENREAQPVDTICNLQKQPILFGQHLHTLMYSSSFKVSNIYSRDCRDWVIKTSMVGVWDLNMCPQTTACRSRPYQWGQKQTSTRNWWEWVRFSTRIGKPVLFPSISNAQLAPPSSLLWTS